MIDFIDVDKRYRVGDGYKVILGGVTVRLPKKNIGVLGANGAGKSTFLRMVSGAEAPTSGQIVCRQKVSFPLGFAGSFNGSLSGMENALFVSRIYAQDTEAIIAYVREFAELGDHLYMPFKTYSSGMRARLAFGISLAIDFELYLVDEITAVGDARFRQRSKQAFMNKLDRANILMVSHGMATLREYCDAGIVLNDGQLSYFDELKDAIAYHDELMKQPAASGGRSVGNGAGATLHK